MGILKAVGPSSPLSWVCLDLQWGEGQGPRNSTNEKGGWVGERVREAGWTGAAY